MSEPDTSTAGTEEIANIHLQFADQERTVSVHFRRGQQTVREVLPVARELAHNITGMAIEAAECQGRKISCRAGCAACCRQLVAISLIDAQALADLVASMPQERQAIVRSRFASNIRRLEEAGLLDPNEPKGSRALLGPELPTVEFAVRAVATRYFQQQIPCPFLENESCSIYSERPLVCREYHVTSPAEDCARLYEIGVECVELPVRMGDCLTHIAHQLSAARLETIPLVLALEWAEAHPGALVQKSDGLQMLQTLMSRIDEQFAQAFDERAAEEGDASLRGADRVDEGHSGHD
jgi:Fe-S-cluster containining protein